MEASEILNELTLSNQAKANSIINDKDELKPRNHDSTQLELLRLELKEDIQSLKFELNGEILNQLEKVLKKNDQKNENNSKLAILKETFVSWSVRTDVNCYGKIFEYSNFFARFFWLISFLISIGITAWIMSWTIRAYLDYSVVSQIGVVYEQKSEFPAVTFCDFNKVTTQQGQNLLDNFTHNSDCYGDFVCGRNKFSDPSVSDENRKK